MMEAPLPLGLTFWAFLVVFCDQYHRFAFYFRRLGENISVLLLSLQSINPLIKIIMKKFLLALYVLLCPLCVIAQDEVSLPKPYTHYDYIEKFGMSALFGCNNYLDSSLPQNASIGLSLTIYDIYFDCGIRLFTLRDVSPYEKTNDWNHVNFHAGYRVHFRHNWGITPVFGWTTQKNLRDSYGSPKFDYGVNFDYNFKAPSMCKLKVTAQLTRYNAMVGFGFAFLDYRK